MKTLIPVATIHTPFRDKFGIPRGRGPFEGRIVLHPPYHTHASVEGIEGFSHLILLWGFHLAEDGKTRSRVRPPRLGGNTYVGVFASRSPFRPNNIGLTVVRLVRVEQTPHGVELVVNGVDMVDGTPLYDIKPYLPHADSIPDAVGGYADQHKDDNLEVVFSCDTAQYPAALVESIAYILKEDPRPHYQTDERVYGLNYDHYEVKFTVADGTAHVLSITPEAE